MEEVLKRYIREYYKPTLVKVMKENGTYESFENSVKRSLDFQFYRLWYWLRN